MTFIGKIAARPGQALSIIVPAILLVIGLLNHAHAQGKPAMQVRDLYPLVTTPQLEETRDFYVSNFDFEVAFEASWFVYLVGPGEEGSRGATLAFMHPDHPSNPPGPESFGGKGMILTVEISNAAEVFERFIAADAPIVYPLTDEEWGQRRFMTRDPAGVLVDIVQQIEPKAGYWDQYLTK